MKLVVAVVIIWIVGDIFIFLTSTAWPTNGLENLIKIIVINIYSRLEGSGGPPVGQWWRKCWCG